MRQLLFQHAEQTLFGEGFGEDIVHAFYRIKISTPSGQARRPNREPTTTEIAVYIVTSDIRRHGNDWCIAIKLANQGRSRASVEVWHHDVHEHKIVALAAHLVDRNQAVILSSLSN